MYMHGYAVDTARVEIQTFCSENLYLQRRSFSRNLLPLGDSHPPFRKTSNEEFFLAKQPCMESCLPLEKPSLFSCARGFQNLQSTADQHNTGKIDISGQFVCSISLRHIEPCADRHVSCNGHSKDSGCQGFNRWK